MPFISSFLAATSSLLYRLFQGAPSNDSGIKLRKAKTGKRYMKTYREKFIKYFPTLLTELIEKELFDPGLKHNAEHLKEVNVNAMSDCFQHYLFAGC